MRATAEMCKSSRIDGGLPPVTVSSEKLQGFLQEEEIDTNIETLARALSDLIGTAEQLGINERDFTEWYDRVGLELARLEVRQAGTGDLYSILEGLILGDKVPYCGLRVQNIIDVVLQQQPNIKDNIERILRHIDPRIQIKDKSETESLQPSLPTPDVSQLVQERDLETLKSQVKDTEHVHWHPRAVIIPDTHGLDPEGVTGRIQQLFPQASIEVKGDGIYVDGEEVPVYQLGDILDPDKDLMGWADGLTLPTHDDYLEALNNEDHPQHEKALQLQGLFDVRPGLEEAYKERWTRLGRTKPTEAAEFWMSHENNALWGNHEAMMIAGTHAGDDDMLLLWLRERNAGRPTFEDFTGQSLSEVIGYQILTSSSIDNFSLEEKARYAEKLRKALLQSDKYISFVNSFLQNANLYQIVNGMVLTHAGIPVDQNGELTIPKTREFAFKGVNKKDVGRFVSGLVRGGGGLPSLDYLEECLKGEDETMREIALKFLANGSTQNMSPLWVRKPFQDVMEKHGDTVLAQLTGQAHEKGHTGKIVGVVVGHTPTIGGQRIGPGLYPADDGEATPVILRLWKGSESEKVVLDIWANHQFGQSVES
jgi:hypothetical protein